jgi:hypothetical protein
LGVWFFSKLRAPVDQSTDAPYGEASTNYRTANSGDDSARSVGITKTDCPPPPPECRYSEKKRKRWWKGWKLWVFALNIATFIAVVFYASVTKRMWTEMQKQSAIQRDTLINSERAWVGQSGPIWLEFFTGNDKRLASKTHVTLENFGHSPALGVVAMATVVENSDLAHSAETTCKFARAEAGFKVPGMFVGKSDIQHTGQTIFPQQKWQLEAALLTSSAQIEFWSIDGGR